MKKITLVLGILVIVVGVTITGCNQPSDPTPDPDPVKVVVSSLTFTNVDTLEQTTIYEWDDAAGTYYTTNGDVLVTADQFTVTIGSSTFVNDSYRDASRNSVSVATGAYYDSITAKFWYHLGGTLKVWIYSTGTALEWTIVDTDGSAGGQHMVWSAYTPDMAYYHE